MDRMRIVGKWQTRTRESSQTTRSSASLLSSLIRPGRQCLFGSSNAASAIPFIIKGVHQFVCLFHGKDELRLCIMRHYNLMWVLKHSLTDNNSAVCKLFLLEISFPADRITAEALYKPSSVLCELGPEHTLPVCGSFFFWISLSLFLMM